MQTHQEKLWSGSFGDEYVDRNQGGNMPAAYSAFWSERLKLVPEVTSVLELGCNVGLNLHAISQVNPAIELSAVEINEKAVATVRRDLPGAYVQHGSILEFKPERQWDLTFTSGVLIHIAPEDLPKAYAALYQASRRFVLVAEYYNPVPVEIPYRNNERALFKRDFAGDLLDAYPDLRLVSYGFCYHRDPLAIDDLTWFLLQK